MIETSKSDIETIVKDYMAKHFLFEFDDKKITDSTNLFQSGLIDSFGFVELITFIESQFKIKLSNEALISNSMNSLSGIVKIINQKLKYAYK